MESQTISISAAKPKNESDNRIKNTKYSLFTFIFKYMLITLPFESVSAVFFLVIIVAQIISPTLRVTPIYASFLPWFIIYLINVLRQGLDNYSRYIRDSEINKSSYKRFRNGQYETVECQSIKVGDLILIEKNQRVPADCILLKSEEISGEIFIRTDQLDGETDWKRRCTLAETQQCSVESLQNIILDVEKSSKDIYSFQGRLKFTNFVKNDSDNSGLFQKPSNNSKIFLGAPVDTIVKSASLENADKGRKNENDEKDKPFIKIGNADSLNEKEEIKILIEEAIQNIPEGEKIANEAIQNIPECIKNSNEDNQNIPEGAKNRNKDNQNIPERQKNGNEDSMAEYAPRLEMGLDLENTVWSNTVVSSSSALCMVIYTGHNTRSMLNTLGPRIKSSQMERELERFIFAMSIISISCAFIFTLNRMGFNFGLEFSLVAFRFIIIFSYVIPISLKFMITTARLLYTYLLARDEILKTAKVQTNSLQEELARISFFLTDKTGTLTKNEMMMKKLHIGTICYNAENVEEISSMVRNITAKMASKQKKSFWRRTKNIETRIYELIEGLSICHNVTPTETEGVLSYQASSPDEIAMANYAANVGLKLVRRTSNEITILIDEANEVVYKILYIFPFNSDTKRMGIIVEKNGEYVFFAKGADTVMKNMIKENDYIEEETDNMGREGLRTLVFAKRTLTKSEFSQFSQNYEKARASLIDRNEIMLQVQNSIEEDLEILGITGVEDKLQDNVKQTIERIRSADIKVWMLTGDKIETAISIAYSSRLLTRSDQYYIISNCTSIEEVDGCLNILRDRKYNSLVIDGKSLEVIIAHLLDKFIGIAKNLHCLIGCRYSPTQKAIMAQHLRHEAGETVLCIGDGGNDVSMITSADVGVGIEGKEGSQASIAADFSIVGFSDIADLMFYHGRRCYNNSAKISHIIFHRGVMISTIQGIFSIMILFFPLSILQGSMATLFILFTIGPLWLMIFDEDISRSVSLKYPELYKELRENDLLNLKQFVKTLATSIFQAAAFILLLFYFDSDALEISFMSLTCFTNLIINEQLMACLSVWDSINIKFILACFFSFLLYTLFFAIFQDNFISLIFTGKRISQIFIMNCIAILPKVLFTISKLYFYPPSHIKIKRGKIE